LLLNYIYALACVIREGCKTKIRYNFISYLVKALKFSFSVLLAGLLFILKITFVPSLVLAGFFVLFLDSVLWNDILTLYTRIGWSSSEGRSSYFIFFIITFIVSATLTFLIDYYVFQALKLSNKKWKYFNYKNKWVLITQTFCWVLVFVTLAATSEKQSIYFACLSGSFLFTFAYVFLVVSNFSLQVEKQFRQESEDLLEFVQH